jgi:hypothetical protein
MPVFRKDHAPTKKLDHDPIKLIGSWFSACVSVEHALRKSGRLQASRFAFAAAAAKISSNSFRAVNLLRTVPFDDP